MKLVVLKFGEFVRLNDAAGNQSAGIQESDRVPSTFSGAPD
jgi:hypothetical protein